MSEPNQGTEAAGEGLSDEEMVETVAEQTDSASENADVAGKDWDGDPSSAPAPDGRADHRIRRPSAVCSAGADGRAVGRAACPARRLPGTRCPPG